MPTILLVEDDDAVRGFVGSILEGAGYEVLRAPNSPEALAFCDDPSIEIDLLLTDMVLPVMSGVELAQKALQKRSGLKVLYMSGYTEYGLAKDGVRERVSSFIWKPFAPAELLSKVGEHLRQPR